MHPWKFCDPYSSDFPFCFSKFFLVFPFFFLWKRLWSFLLSALCFVLCGFVFFFGSTFNFWYLMFDYFHCSFQDQKKKKMVYELFHWISCPAKKPTNQQTNRAVKVLYSFCSIRKMKKEKEKVVKD